MDFTIRPFAQCVESFAAIDASGKLREYGEKTGHYATQKAFSFGRLGSWPSNPPVTSLYLMEKDVVEREGATANIKSCVEFLNIEAVGTFNANGHAYWQKGNNWLVASIELMQEQSEDGSCIDVVLACWQVEEGFAAAVIDRAERKTVLPAMIGFDWPEQGWEEEDVWYGE